MSSKSHLNKVNPELRRYIETDIFPQYSQNDPGHQLKHINFVIRRSFKFAEYARERESAELSNDLIYTIAAYHDLGHHVDPETHEEISAQILLDDEKLPEFFTPDELELAAKAVREHRSTFHRTQRGLYGKILVSADFTINIDMMMCRTYAYRLRNSPESTLEETIEESRQHLLEKYGRNGYALDKMYFPDPEFTSVLDELDKLVHNPPKFRERYLKINDIKLQ